jgi:hypothetical protein
MAMWCGNALGHHKLKLVMLGKAKKPCFLKVPKQTAFLSIIATRKEPGWIGRFLKINSTTILFQKFRLS